MTPNTSNPPKGEPPRRSFALTGRSAALDPRTHAVRADLADIRLADRVFAPHYAAPRMMTLRKAALLRASAAADADTLGDLKPGDAFEAFEFSGTHTWGIAPRLGLVGYVDAAAFA